MRWKFWTRRPAAQASEQAPVPVAQPTVRPESRSAVGRSWTRLPGLETTIRITPPALVPVLRLPAVAGTRSLLHRPRRPAADLPPVPSGLVTATAVASLPVEPEPVDPEPAEAYAPAPEPIQEPAPEPVRLAPRPVLTRAVDEYVGAPAEPEEPFRSVSMFERTMQQYLNEDDDDLDLTALIGFSSSAAPPPMPTETVAPAGRSEQVLHRPTLAQSRRLGLRGAPKETDTPPAERSETAEEPDGEPHQAPIPVVQNQVSAPVEPPAPRLFGPELKHAPRIPADDDTPEPSTSDSTPTPPATPEQPVAPTPVTPKAVPAPPRLHPAAPKAAEPRLDPPAAPSPAAPRPTPPAVIKAVEPRFDPPTTAEKPAAAPSLPTPVAAQQPPELVHAPGTVERETTKDTPPVAEPVAAEHTPSAAPIPVVVVPPTTSPAAGPVAPTTPGPAAPARTHRPRDLATPPADDTTRPSVPLPADPAGMLATTPPAAPAPATVTPATQPLPPAPGPWVPPAPATMLTTTPPPATPAPPTRPPVPVGVVYRAPLATMGAPPPTPPGPAPWYQARLETVPADLAGTFMTTFGVDVTAVPVRRGSVVSDQARQLGARAFTRGGEVHLPDEEGDLAGPGARSLLAHELVHAAQQHLLGDALPAEETAEGKQLEDVAVAAERWALGESAPPVALVHRQLPTAQAPARPPDAVQRAEGDSITAFLDAAREDRRPEDASAPPQEPAQEPTQVTKLASWAAPDAEAWSPQPRPPLPLESRSSADLTGVRDQLSTMEQELAELRQACARAFNPADRRSLDDLAARLYNRLRGRLRAELLIDRERAGTLADRG